MVDRIAERERPSSAETGIWADNWDILLAYLAVSSQWRVAALASGGLFYVGLDYTAVRARLGRVTADVWDGLQVIEAETKSLLNGAG